MDFLLNVLLGLLAFFVVRWLAGEISIPAPIGVILGVIAFIFVYFADFAVKIRS